MHEDEKQKGNAVLETTRSLNFQWEYIFTDTGSISEET